MLAVLSAMLVMMESGSVPTAPRVDLSVDVRVARLDTALTLPLSKPAESPLRLGRALSDCDPGIVGIESGADRLVASQDLLICRAAMLKDEPVGRAFLWIGGQTGLQAAFSASRIQLNVRFAP